jgi:hypothetical protein
MPGSDQIPELIQARGEILLSVIHKLINSIWNKDELSISGRSMLLYKFIKRVTKLTVIPYFSIDNAHVINIKKV